MLQKTNIIADICTAIIFEKNVVVNEPFDYVLFSIIVRNLWSDRIFTYVIMWMKQASLMKWCYRVLYLCHQKMYLQANLVLLEQNLEQL